MNQQHPNQPKTMTTGLKVLIGAGVVTGILALAGIAAAAGGDSAVQAASTPQPTVTVTAPAEPGTEVTVTAPPVTVTKPEPPAKTVTAEPAETPAAMEEPGTYLVGTDVKPGTYKSAGGDGCYWERLKNLDGGFGAIIANDFVDGGTTIVTIKKSDKAFKFNDCAGFVKIK